MKIDILVRAPTAPSVELLDHRLRAALGDTVSSAFGRG